MFKGIQNILNKVSNKGAEPPEPGALPVMRAAELLAPEKHKHVLDKLPEILNLDTMKFNSHVATLIDEFAEFVQLLPETQNSYFAKPGGILEHGLHRAVLGASMCRAYFLPKEPGKEDALTQQQILWAYAVFSAGLLHDIGKVAVDLSVTMFDRYTNSSKPWILWEGAMVGAATDYKYEFSPLNLDEFRRRATLIIARQLLPEQSFLWLASDADVFAAWLAMLQDDERGGGLIGRILPFADAEILKKYFLEHKSDKKITEKKDVKLSNAGSTFSKTKRTGEAFTTTTAINAELGKEFLNWAEKNIEKGTIKVNQEKDGVIRVTEGVLVTQAAFENFIKDRVENNKMPETTKLNWHDVALALASLKLHEQHPQEPVIQKYASIEKEKPITAVEGVVIKNSNMIFPQTVTAEVHQHFVKVPMAAVAAAGVNTLVGTPTVQMQVDLMTAIKSVLPPSSSQPPPTPPPTPTPIPGAR